MDYEKNDVDISRLFSWGRVFILEGKDGQEEGIIYMRLLGDADVNRARVYALRKGAELRRKLHDKNSDERLSAIKDFEDMEIEDIVNYILVFSMREITNSAIKEIQIPAPKQPKSNAKLEKLEKYQADIDSYNDRKKEAINKYIKKEVDKLKTMLLTESKEALYKKYEKSLIEEFCEQEAMRAYDDMQIYLGCYRDDTYKEKFFEAFEQYDNLLVEQKALIRQAYNTLNIGMDDLKKLREVTQ
jgi:hypothetical protein